MNRLQILKRALLSVSGGIKNLLCKDWQNHIGTKQVDIQLLDNGIKGTVKTLSGGYTAQLHFLIIENPQWGKTYTLTCNIEESISNMNNALRIGYWRSNPTVWNNIKEIAINKGNGVYSVTFTLPAEQPELFRPDIVNDYYGGLRMFFNVQKTAGLTEYGALTITDIVITQDD